MRNFFLVMFFCFSPTLAFAEGADDYLDKGWAAYKLGEYQTALKWNVLAAEQAHHISQEQKHETRFIPVFLIHRQVKILFTMYLSFTPINTAKPYFFEVVNVFTFPVKH